MTFDIALRFRIESHFDGKVISIQNKKIVQESNNDKTKTWEDWRLIQLDGPYEIMSENPKDNCRGQCLTQVGENNQVQLQPWRFYNNNDQRWIFQEIESGLYKIIANATSNPELVLTIGAVSTEGYAPITTEKFKDRENQRWRIHNVDFPKSKVFEKVGIR